MICYPNGTEAKIRDRVRIDHGAYVAIVHAVVDSEKRRRSWGVEGLGLMVETANHGMVFWPIGSLVPEEIEFVSHEAA
jgi:hypothetical protein